MEVKKLMKKIDALRKYMYELIEEKSDLVDPEVVEASQMLDSALYEYYKILEKKRNT
ncbi:aspartyl-phosphate phosphatase Spo0E family protein [uncultured Clostridium sp.]|uniref:aspartyl-phosphate phosphatase Spo0E family protein n=1 Tax=uncultured Clostridium sp. TaxID=59620 RepID=UPI0028EE083C|nr:aspartyl-phosphate phosphatase Spo0E family protein [uncultured Clostridium sp.]